MSLSEAGYGTDQIVDALEAVKPACEQQSSGNFLMFHLKKLIGHGVRNQMLLSRQGACEVFGNVRADQNRVLAVFYAEVFAPFVKEPVPQPIRKASSKLGFLGHDAMNSDNSRETAADGDDPIVTGSLPVDDVRANLSQQLIQRTLILPEARHDATSRSR